MKKLLWLGGAALALAACGNHKPKAELEPLPVLVVQPQPEGLSAASARFPARLVRENEVVVSFRVGGVLGAVPARIGDRVAPGAVVASLVDTPYAQAARRAAADVARLERAARRNEGLVASGAISTAERDDTLSALDAARAAQTAAQYDLRSASVRAAFSGVVLERLKEAGETVAPGEPVLRMASQNSAWLARVQVAAAAAARLKPGAAASVRLPGLGDVSGEVRRIGGGSDPATGTVTVEVALRPEAGLASGLVGSAAFADLAQAQGTGLTIPVEALVDARNGAGHVFIVDPARKTATLRPVQILALRDEHLSVRGLSADMSVITDGAGFASEGRRVAVVSR